MVLIKDSKYTVVPEDVIREAANYTADDPDNSFSRLLKVAQEYKEANCKPIFILDPYNMDMFVVIEETFRKKLH